MSLRYMIQTGSFILVPPSISPSLSPSNDFISAYCQLFAANKEKPPEIISILVANRSKLLRFFSDFKMDKGGPEKEVFLLLSSLVLFDAFHL